MIAVERQIRTGDLAHAVETVGECRGGQGKQGERCQMLKFHGVFLK